MTELRPWGYFQILHRDRGYLVKKLVVLPGQSLSLQHHEHRSEMWCIADGLCATTVGESVVTLPAGSVVAIGAGQKHRAQNIGNDDLVIIECQRGELLSENDIVRHDDQYGRAK